MYIDNIKIFSKNKNRLKTFIKTIRIYSQYIGMEFGIETCHVNKLKKKWGEEKELELANQESMRTLGEKKNSKYLGILDWFGFMAYQPFLII